MSPASKCIRVLSNILRVLEAVLANLNIYTTVLLAACSMDFNFLEQLDTRLVTRD